MKTTTSLREVVTGGAIRPRRDDHVTSGGTLNELRSHIENNGGRVVAVACLTASAGGAILKPEKATIDELKRRYPDIDRLLRDAGIAGRVEALTAREAGYIKTLSPDAFRDRVAQARLERAAGEAEGKVGAPPSEGVARDSRRLSGAPRPAPAREERERLAEAGRKAAERADYWENAVRLEDADKAQMDADLGAAPANNSAREDSSSRADLALESPTAENGETPPAAKEKAAEHPAEYLAWLEKYKMKDTDGHFAEWQRKQTAQNSAKNATASAPSAEGTTDAPQVVKTTRDGESVRIVENGREYEVELPDVKFPKTFTKATSKADWEAKMAEAKKIADELKKKAPFHSVINPKTGKYYTNGSEVARRRRREVTAYEESVRRATNQAFDEIGEYDDSWDEESINAAPKKEAATTPPKAAKPAEGGKGRLDDWDKDVIKVMSDFVSGVSGASIKYNKDDVIGEVKINGKDTAFTVSTEWPFDKGEPATAAQYRYDETDGFQWQKLKAAANEWNKLDSEHTAEVYDGDNSVNFRSLEEALNFEMWLAKRAAKPAQGGKSASGGAPKNSAPTATRAMAKSAFRRGAPVQESRTTEKSSQVATSRKQAIVMPNAAAATKPQPAEADVAESVQADKTGVPDWLDDEGIADIYNAPNFIKGWGAAVSAFYRHQVRTDGKLNELRNLFANETNEAKRKKLNNQYKKRINELWEHQGEVQPQDEMRDAINAIQSREGAISQMKPSQIKAAKEKISPQATQKTAEKPPETAKPVSETPKTEVSATTPARPAAPAFRRGDRVFIKGAKDGQRVTFLKANADGTADVQVRTPGANRYAPEKVETRTVPMGDVETPKAQTGEAPSPETAAPEAPKPAQKAAGMPQEREEAARQGKTRPNAAARPEAVSGANTRKAVWKDSSGREREWPGFVSPESLSPKEGLVAAVRGENGGVLVGRIAKLDGENAEIVPYGADAEKETRTFPRAAIFGVRDPAAVRDSMRGDPALRRIDAAYRAAKTDAERNALKAQFAERVRALQKTPSGRQKQAGAAYPDASQEIRVLFDTPAFGKKSREEFGRVLAKSRPDLDADAVIGEIAKFDTPKKRKAALHWVVRGAIRLPEDAYKVEDALSVAEKAKADPFAYRSPLELIEAHRDIKPTRRAIDPATVPELSDPRDEGDGIVSYEVADTREGQAAMRRVIDTHWGEDANPWCLLARQEKSDNYFDFVYTWDEVADLYDDPPENTSPLSDGEREYWKERSGRWWDGLLPQERERLVRQESSGDWSDEKVRRTAARPGVDGFRQSPLKDYFLRNVLFKERPEFAEKDLARAWSYWRRYSALPKRVAFKDGRLLAFMATERLDLDNWSDYQRFKDRLEGRYPERVKEYESWTETEEAIENGIPEFPEWMKVNYGGEFDSAWGTSGVAEEWWDRQDESHPDLDWARGNAQVNFDTPGIYTGTAADYANRSRQGGVDDGPSLKKIGTGEGSQVYGWGLYGSTVRGVADRYAKNGRGAGGKDWIKEGRNHDELSNVEKEAASYLKGMGSKKAAIERLKEDIEWFEKQGIKDEAEALKPIVEELSAHGDEYREQHENVYEQTFFTNRAPGDERHLLKWYEPVTDEQKQWIERGLQTTDLGLPAGARNSARAAAKLMSEVLSPKSSISGGELYQAISDALGSPQAASEFLYRAGIDGVKYPVDSYGAKTMKDGDEAGWNYVAFSDEHIRVDHKWTDGVLQFDTPELAEDGGANGFSLTDTSRGYKVADLRNDRPYLQKNNQAANGALLHSGNAGGSRLDQRSVAAAHSSLERIASSLQNPAPKVKGMVDSLLSVLDGMKSGKPIFDGGKPLTAKNFVTSMQSLGFKRGEGAKSAYYTVDGETTTRASDHSANAELFVQDGTDNNLSIVIRRPHDRKRFEADNGVNAIEAVFPRADLEAHPEKLPQIIRDMGEFIATGEYHDTAGALAYNFSGDAAYQAKARDRVYADALARGDMETAQRMVREAAARAMPDTKAVDDNGEPLVVFHGTTNEETRETWNPRTRTFDIEHSPFTVFRRRVDGVRNSGAFFNSSEDNAGGYGSRVYKVFLNLRNPLVIDANNSDYSRITHNGATRDTYEWAEWAERNGYDGLIIKNVRDGVDYGAMSSATTDYVAFRPNQIKSADPVTRDDAGNVIPLSQRFNPQNDDIRFDTPELSPVTPAEDAAYMDAVRRGDMETAQRMVLDAARRKGGKYYRATSKELAPEGGVPWMMFVEEGAANEDSVTGPLYGERGGYGEHLFVATDRDSVDLDDIIKSKKFNKAAKEFYGDDVEVTPENFNPSDIVDSAGMFDDPDFIQKLYDDGVIDESVKAIRTNDGLVVMGDSRSVPGLVKSLDPVTRDDAGNVIPLSQRFNPRNDDIRFDTPDLTPAEAEYAAGEDKTPTEKVMREVYGMTNDEIATALKAAGMEPPAHVRKTDADMMRQAETLLSNPTYMAKLSRAVAKFPRPDADELNPPASYLDKSGICNLWFSGTYPKRIPAAFPWAPPPPGHRCA